MLGSKIASSKDSPTNEIVRCLAACELGESNRLWLAFSGGLDSTVLLQLAACAVPAKRLGAIHVNHRLSPNANAWQRHCEREAERLGIEFVNRCVNLHGGNCERLGRQARFRVFNEVMQRGDVVATAHHRNDELESLMWQLATGRAMVGIATWRQLDNGQVWRPLLNFSRRQLRNIAELHGWTWVEDESNLDVSLTRNALRHEIFPRIQREFPEFAENLIRHKLPPLEQIQRNPMQTTSVAGNPTRVRAWLHAFGITPKQKVVDEIMRQALARRDASVAVRVSSRVTVRRFEAWLYVVPDAERNFNEQVSVGDSHRYTFGQLGWERRRRGLSNNLKMQVGTRRGGERIVINRRVVRLATWFYEQRIPPWERDAWPLFFIEDALVAVSGLGVADTAAAADGWMPTWVRTAACA